MKNILFLLLLLPSLGWGQQGLSDAITNKVSQTFELDASHIPANKGELTMFALDPKITNEVVRILEERGYEVTSKGGLLDGYVSFCDFNRSGLNILSLSKNGVALYAAIILREGSLVKLYFCDYPALERP